MSLRTILSNYGFALQREFFPTLEEELGPLGRALRVIRHGARVRAG